MPQTLTLGGLRGEEEELAPALLHDYQPLPSDKDPDSLHQWDDLVEKRKSVRESFEAGASDSAKARVKQRLEAALNFIIPTYRDGTRFFMWYRSKQGRFHGELDLEDAKKEFETRHWGEFVYDDVSNQWDICSLFDKDRESPLEDTQTELPLQEILATPAPLLHRPPALPSDHNEVGRTVVHLTLIGEDVMLPTSLEDVLNSRCGLLCSSEDEIRSAADFVKIEDSQIVDTHTVCKYIMEINLPLEHHSNEFAVQYFVSTLTLELQPPSIIWDLHPDHTRQLLSQNAYFQVQEVKDRSIPGYLVLPLVHKYTRTWNLFLRQATSVVQCIREQWGPSLEDVVLCLFERGILFKVLFHAEYPTLPRPFTVFESNRRPFGWTADKYKYADYELRRNRLLRLLHVRVAAAQAGGILWRLCKQELANDIPNRPSADVVYFADMSTESSSTTP
ncbi:hypothetical protein CY34DRAFT_18146 [Suillus luteus UH-Slu-Lm8-n1]|uniref:Uncharacterized protein n=1 Tax=Suillus luteus UH-Slu-Lm8-n1 TaxID=930992 RepID=A0A0D0APA7_9AGAM|nr:hypothetical protein CY34DRAFT_18146 [Suillus luteus UH-Slu-Lm8-n1]